MPIKIDFLSNVRDFIRGTDDVDKALDDVADSLDDVTRDGDRGVERLEDSFRDAARRAKDLGDAGRDAGDDVKRGMRRAEDGVEEFKDEANSTAKEAAASFDGSAESIGDALQEIAANAFAGFGPAGEVAGLAAAAGIGLAVSGFDQMNQAEEESRARAAEWADAYIAAGSRILTSSQLIARTNEIITDPDKFKKASESAEKWGVTVETAVLAYAGQEASLEAVSAAVDKQKAAYTDLKDELVLGTDAEVKATQAMADSAGALAELNKEMENGRIQSSIYSQALRDIADNTAGATKKVDEFGDSVTTLPDGTVIYIDAETGQATTDVNAIEQKVYGIQDKTITISADTSNALASFNGLVKTISNKKVLIDVSANPTGSLKGWQ